MGIFHNLQSFPQGLWRIKSSPKAYLLALSTMFTKLAIGEKKSVKGRLVALHFFGHLKGQ